MYYTAFWCLSFYCFFFLALLRNHCYSFRSMKGHKISRILSDFQFVFNFEQTRTVAIFGEHGVMAH